MKFSSCMSPDHSWSRSAALFKEYVEENSGGRIAIEVFNANSLGSNREVLEMIKMGTVDFMNSGVTHASNNVPELGILRETAKHGGPGSAVVRRIAVQSLLAADLRPDMILFTCSATSPAVDPIRAMVSAPIMKIDEPMAEAAVTMGNRIGFIATAKGSFGPGVDMLKAKALAAGKDVSITPVLLEPAFAAVQAGNSAEHDRLVGETARELAADHQAVVLGQASMAHLAGPLSRETGKPVLGSVPFCLEALKKLEAG